MTWNTLFDFEVFYFHDWPSFLTLIWKKLPILQETYVLIVPPVVQPCGSFVSVMHNLYMFWHDQFMFVAVEAKFFFTQGQHLGHTGLSWDRYTS